MIKRQYYDIRDDINLYPNLWCYIVYSKRGPGKTYSTLRMVKEDNKKFIFMKRTIEDVKQLCKGSGSIDDPIDGKAIKPDLSPFKPLNRDFGWSVRCFSVGEGMAGFWNCEINDKGQYEPVDEPIGYALAATAVSKFKGFDLSECDYIIYDEFIPRPWDRINHKEGDQILDLYETVNRDRIDRGRSELILICLANATSISNPFFLTMDLVDVAAEMDIKSTEYYVNDYRGVMLHQIPERFGVNESITDEELKANRTGIQRCMEETQWGAMAYGGHFGYNDFSNVGKVSLRAYVPRYSIKIKKNTYFIYQKQHKYFVSKSPAPVKEEYDLNFENDQKRFYLERCIDLRNECINNNVIFETYTVYDVVANYKKYYKV